MYETFAHTADLGLRVRAETPAELYREAARGLLSMLVVNLDEVRPVNTVTIEVRNDEADYRLFDWLTEILFLFDTRHLLLCEFDIRCDENELIAICRGEHLDHARHEMDHEVKAITYHRLKVEQDERGWLAEVIVDI